MDRKSTGAMAIEAGQEWDVIPLLEQILESQPRDLAALEELTRAYCSVGEISKACQYGQRLADLVLQSGETGLMAGLREVLQPLAGADPALGESVQKIDACLAADKAGKKMPDVAQAMTPAPAPDQATRARAPAPGAVSRLRVVGRPAEQAGKPPDVRQPDVLETVAPASESAPASQTSGREEDDALSRVAAFLGNSSAAPSQTPPAAAPPNPAARAAARATRKANPLSDPGRRRTIISEEMNFAWDLQQTGMLSEEQYAAVVRDLTELSSSEIPVTISALHVLHFRSFPNIDQVLLHISGKSETPMLPLTSFDPQGSAFSALPIEYIIVQGVIPFESMGSDLLVALLNPLNERIRLEIQEITGQRCHFFLVAPAEFDTTLETVKTRYPAAAALRQQAEA